METKVPQTGDAEISAEIQWTSIKFPAETWKAIKRMAIDRETSAMQIVVDIVSKHLSEEEEKHAA